MSDFALINANLWRKKLRTSLLLFAIFIAFFIFTALMSVHSAFYGSAQSTAPIERLVTVNKINFTVSMPFSYFNRVASTEGVAGVTHASWFGGYYQEPRNFVQSFAVDGESYLEVYPEIALPDDQREAFLDDRSGLLVGEALAAQYGWEVGDQVPLLSGIWQRTDGTYLWTFNVSGIFSVTEDTAPTNYAIFHYDYYNEPLAFNRDQIGWMVIAPASPDLVETLPDAIDAQFANSPYETETATESAFSRAFLAQLGNIGLILISVTGAAFVTILLIVGNTMVMAVRERTREIGVMKTLGFTSGRIFRIVLGESILLAVIGGVLGVGAGWFMVSGAAEAIGGALPGLGVTPMIALGAFAIMIALGLITGAVPAFNAMRLRVVDALGRG